MSLKSDLIGFLGTNYLPEEKIKISKDGTETIFYRKGGKSLCYIETKAGKSTVTIVIGVSLADKVESADTSQQVKEKFKAAKQFHDGKWLFFELKTHQDLQDVKNLLTIKRRPLQK